MDEGVTISTSLARTLVALLSDVTTMPMSENIRLDAAHARIQLLLMMPDPDAPQKESTP